ncbi:hypothetical protein Q7P37_007941 [Cladosporium fusiforme]
MLVQTIFLGLAALAAAVPTNCPKEVTTTEKLTGTSTTTAIVTSTTKGTTYTMSVPTYTSTKTVTRGTTTKYVSKTTGSVPVVKTETSIKCTASTTNNVEFTSTVYKGSYTPSSLSPQCLPSTSTKYVWAGTKVVTSTKTDGVRITTSTPAVKTKTKYRKTVTSTDYAYDLPSTATSTTTVTRPGFCTKTVTTATASATSTYAAKCKPSNMIEGSSPHDTWNTPESWIEFGQSHPSNKDPSACCQACADDKSCEAMWYRTYQGQHYCIKYSKEKKDTCGLAYAINPYNSLEEDSGRHGQVGCGSISYKIAA